MRPVAFIVAAALPALATGACRSSTNAGPEDANVYVPSGADAGLNADAEAGVDGAGLATGQVDRAGRPLVSILLVPDSLKDDYNAASTFDAPLSRTLGDGLTARLQALDTLAIGDAGPDPVDWPIEGGAHPLLPVLAPDALLVDTALPCASADGGYAASYLDIEREIFPGVFESNAVHTTCGGRTPSDDVVDTTLSLLVTRNRAGAAQVTQGLVGPAKPATQKFPYLAEPYSN